MSISIGKQFPDFILDGVFGKGIKKYSLEDFKGKWLLLFFYPADFSPICPTELEGFYKRYLEFKMRDCQIAGCSVDSIYTHQKRIADGMQEIQFPLLSDGDFSFSRKLGIFDEEWKQSARGTYLINPDGNLEWVMINKAIVARSITEIIRMIDAVQTGGFCPVNWQPGQPLLT